MRRYIEDCTLQRREEVSERQLRRDQGQGTQKVPRKCVPSLLVFAVAHRDEGIQQAGGGGTEGNSIEKSEDRELPARGCRGMEQKSRQRNKGNMLPTSLLD